MTRSRPNFVAAEAEAKRLLRELGLTTLPVDPFDVARRLDMELRPLPSNAGGASGMLLRSGEHFWYLLSNPCAERWLRTVLCGA